MMRKKRKHIFGGLLKTCECMCITLPIGYAHCISISYWGFLSSNVCYNFFLRIPIHSCTLKTYGSFEGSAHDPMSRVHSCNRGNPSYFRKWLNQDDLEKNFSVKYQVLFREAKVLLKSSVNDFRDGAQSVSGQLYRDGQVKWFLTYFDWLEKFWMTCDLTWTCFLMGHGLNWLDLT
jgi:hypothetical protein